MKKTPISSYPLIINTAGTKKGKMAKWRWKTALKTIAGNYGTPM